MTGIWSNTSTGSSDLPFAEDSPSFEIPIYPAGDAAGFHFKSFLTREESFRWYSENISGKGVDSDQSIYAVPVGTPPQIKDLSFPELAKEAKNPFQFISIVLAIEGK